MSEQRSPQFGAARRVSATPLQRAYLATLTRRLFARRLFSPSGPAAFSHAVAIRLAQAQQRPRHRR